jgi:hypothetical protein
LNQVTVTKMLLQICVVILSIDTIILGLPLGGGQAVVSVHNIITGISTREEIRQP